MLCQPLLLRPLSEEHNSTNNDQGGAIRRNEEAFTNSVLTHLVKLGVQSPLLSVKLNGVGEYLAYVSARFFQSRKGRCPATVSVVGAIASQEVIKAITGVHRPLQQMLLFESLDSLPKEASQSSRDSDSDMTRVYGDLARTVQKLRVFVVGAGAIGCELLKNFALMGVGCPEESAEEEEFEDTDDDDDDEEDEESQDSSILGLWRDKGLQEGGIIVADMDSIEKSNLNRQLLFRPKHIGASKAETAASFIKTINPNMRVWGANTKVQPDSSVFDEMFWRETSLITTALDNVEARRFVDSEAVRYRKCLIDAGTQGTSGNTQVVYPYLTESYSSTSDPVDDSIPLCTLKSFPYQVLSIQLLLIHLLLIKTL
jgi:ubiquitin-activating enzyme E1